MLRSSGTEIVTSLAMSLLVLVTVVSAEAPASGAETESRRLKEPRRWSPSFLLGSTKFNDSESHRTFGATFRVRLTERISFEPELRYMSLPGHESASGTRTWRHSDLTVAGHVVYDFRDEKDGRIVPYVMGGAGWIQTRNESTWAPMPVESSVPIFPPPPPAPTLARSRTVTNWLWLGSAFGVRFLLPHGFFVSPEVRVGGGTEGDLSASAVVKIGYRF